VKRVRIENVTKGRAIAQANHATSMWARFWGLMGKKPLPEGEALLIDPCSSVHTMFMRFPIDVVYISKDNRVVKIAPEMRAWRAGLGGKGAHKVLEMLPGTAAAVGLEVSDELRFDPVD
jgi:uncharacterized membrane protein (UPF0127 family)